jgi:hypothetical protein
MKHASWARSTGCLDSVIPVEEEKPEKEQGFYLHPELYHQPIEKSVWLGWAPRVDTGDGGAIQTAIVATRRPIVPTVSSSIEMEGSMKHLRWQAALAAFTLLFPLIGSGQQLPVFADTELSSNSPTKNFGTSPTLTVDSAHSVLLSFDLANLLPAGVAAGQINRARLILFPDAVTTNGSFKIVDVSGSWNEGTVTYSTKPALSSGSTTASVTTAFTYVEVPLLALVQTWITNPSSNHGIEVWGDHHLRELPHRRELVAEIAIGIAQIEHPRPKAPERQ